MERSAGQASGGAANKLAGRGGSVTLNLSDLSILIADSNAYARRIIHGILRGFGANKLLEVANEKDLLRTLTVQKIDILICDERLPEHGGLALARAIRRNAKNENRTMPILVMTGDARESTIRQARDAGANMVVTKPMSPKSLYDRLAWIAFRPRKFIDTDAYFGPDRRFKTEGYPGPGRRKGDKDVAVAAEAGPALGQDAIDSAIDAPRSGENK
jgi:CheY-like chemotaxis protein